MSSSGAVVKEARLPSLDGWRALSIVLVLGEHNVKGPGFPNQWQPFWLWVFDGGLGVRFFFVISGFLITYLLLVEQRNTGRVDLRGFYARRALRILPVYGCYMLVLLALQWMGYWRQSGVAWLANCTMTTDFFTWGGNIPWATKHLWSLAIEEQFYLLWPPLLIWAGAGRRPRALLWILCVPLVVAPLSRVFSFMLTFGPSHFMAHFSVIPLLIERVRMVPWIKPLMSGYSLFNYFDSLAMGGIAAVLLAHRRPALTAVCKEYRGAVICAGAMSVGIPYALGNLNLLASLTHPFAYTFEAAGFAVLLLQSVLFPEGFAILNGRAIRTVGVLSYSLYIWQQLFCMSLPSPWWILAAFCAAAVSYNFVEKPFLKLRARFRPRQSGLPSPEARVEPLQGRRN